MNVALAQKAVAHGVLRRRDGSYIVAGEHANYEVTAHEHIDGGYFCTCPARGNCSHVLAVKFHRQQQAKNTKAGKQ